MIKRYCDKCGAEITDKNIANFNNRISAEIKTRNGRMMVEVISGKDSTWNDGDFCKYCILDALYTLDDRKN